MKRFKKFSLITLLCTLCMMLFAFAACSSDLLKYRLSDDGEFYYVWAYDPQTKEEIENNDDHITYLKNAEEIVVPATYKDKEVKILAQAFFNCKEVNTITLSEGIKTIGSGAFRGCSATIYNFPISLEEFTGNVILFSSKVTINYAGTKEQWKQINNVTLAYHNQSTTVICSDGKL